MILSPDSSAPRHRVQTNLLLKLQWDLFFIQMSCKIKKKNEYVINIYAKERMHHTKSIQVSFFIESLELFRYLTGNVY